MTITVDWSVTPWLITIPKSDLTLDIGTKYTLTVDTFWQLLRDFSDSAEAIPRPILYLRIPATASTPSITEIDEDYYDLQFEDGLYSVNIIGGNTNIRDVEIKNQVSVNTNNTTGFIDPVFLEDGLFNGAVCIDVINGVSGTGKTPSGGIIGTRQTPSNNIADAKIIAVKRGFVTFNLINSFTVSSEDLSAGFRFTGDSPFLVLTIDPSANITNCTVVDLTLQGEIDGTNVIRECRVQNITEVSGLLDRIAIDGNITLNGPILLADSYSNHIGGGQNIIIGLHETEIRNFHGSIGISGMTGGIHSIAISEGKLAIAADCTGGTIYVRGQPYEIEDNSNGLVTIIDQSESKKLRDIHGGTIREVWLNPSLASNGNGYQQSPYNNLTDAIDDAEANGVTTLVLLDDITLDRTLKNFVVRGIGTPTIDLAGFDLKGSEFRRVRLTGTYIDEIIVQESVLLPNFFLNGFFENCALAGDLFCVDGGLVFMKNCASSIPGLGRPTISMNGAGWTKLSVRGHGGGLTIKNCNHVLDEVTVEMGAIGSLTFDASCTNGSMVARTGGKFVDETAGAVVTAEIFSQELWIIKGLDPDNDLLITDNSRIAGNISQTIDDDGTTTTVARP